jgi:hypothetical protein
MRCRFDARKSKKLRANPRRGIGFEEAQERSFPILIILTSGPIFLSSIAVSGGCQIGYTRSFLKFARMKKVSTFIWSLSGNRRRKKGTCMKSTRNKTGAVSAEAIAREAERGKDVSRFFTSAGKMVGPIQRVNVDFTATMLRELDGAANELNVSRQAVIKTLLRQALDQHYLAQESRSKGD